MGDAPPDADRARMLETAGYRYNQGSDAWVHPRLKRALAGGMVAQLSEEQLRTWIAIGVQQGPQW